MDENLSKELNLSQTVINDLPINVPLMADWPFFKLPKHTQGLIYLIKRPLRSAPMGAGDQEKLEFGVYHPLYSSVSIHFGYIFLFPKCTVKMGNSYAIFIRQARSNYKDTKTQLNVETLLVIGNGESL
jgi:hypothetical protein